VPETPLPAPIAGGGAVGLIGGIIEGDGGGGGEDDATEGETAGAETRPTAKPTTKVAMIAAKKSPGFMFVGSVVDS
jgi:hypothetical protein